MIVGSVITTKVWQTTQAHGLLGVLLKHFIFP